MENNNKYTQLIFLILLFVFITFITINLDFNRETDILIDLNLVSGTVNIKYGSNEDNNNPRGFIYNDEYRNFHNDVGSEYIRIWLSAQWYRPSSFPILKNGTYDYTNFDSLVNAVLDIGATPFVVFAHYTTCGYGYEYTEKFDFSRCEGHGCPPPEDYYEFADYVENSIKHFKEKCDKNEYSAECNISEWYFEIWNEPYGEDWWADDPSEYSKMFNISYETIKRISPESRVGGYTGSYFKGSKYNYRAEEFLKNTKTDFISLHHYGNTKAAYTNQVRMDNIKPLLYDAVIDLKNLARRYGKNNIEIINSEYSSDFTSEYAKNLGKPFTAAWYASALINQIKSHSVSMELFYSGTSSLDDGGFGMWSSHGEIFPTYYMKKDFVKYNKKDSSILYTSFNDKLVDVLAVKNKDGKFITIVNKLNTENSINLEITGEVKERVDLNNDERYKLIFNKAEIDLEPYEVKFLEIK